MDKTWFEMKDIRKRRIADAVWIPLRVSRHITRDGTYGYAGYKVEFFGLGSVAFPMQHRADVKKLSWSEIGVAHGQRVWATSEYYKPAEIYQYRDKIDLGIDLVLVQTFETDDPSEWHLNQDLVFALGLMREGDDWVRPSEDYCIVARLLRDSGARPVAIEIRNEYLRDYLCARNMFLRMSLYRSRDVIVEDVAEVGSPKEENVKSESDRFELRNTPIIEGGHLGDGGYAVFNVSRTDVDPDEDVPRPGPETDSNTASRSWKGKHEGRPLFRIMGELWRDEEIEPGEHSYRIRGDNIPSGIQYIVDATGTRLRSEDLQDEDDPRWLWFRPEVVPALTKHRGGRLRWYTNDTGGVSCSSNDLTHFGLNGASLVTVYAPDIAKLPLWQQRIWSGYNVAPEGGVSKELLSAQMATKVAETTAPEDALPQVLAELDGLFQESIGTPLFRSHTATAELMKSVSRFRALEPNGLLSLAKDLIRLVADRIDTTAVQKMAPPPAGECWKSIKSLEKYLATIVSPENARRVTGALAGAYDLRLADAHLPPEELSHAYKLVRVDPEAPLLDQGFWLIASVVSALIEIGRIMKAAEAKPGKS
ncbi:MAG TPA: hypothetical protein VFC38_05705 [Stellaceae bacterium]|nr:hypothetical protein [Stellaceae bacterium]